MKHILYLLTTIVLLSSCKKEEELTTAKVKFIFTFNWDGTPVELDDFNDIKYTNDFGNELSITRMRYLLSNISFNKSESESYTINGYNLVDFTNQTGLTYNPTDAIPIANYSSVSFTFGFDEIDNAINYIDLNTVNWSWPSQLGGGYHFMQFEGKYIDANNETTGFAYHHGTAKKEDAVFEANHFTAVLEGIDLKEDTTLEIKMNIAEWFKNPYQWDLNVYDQMLMPNYNAQKKMQENGVHVFSSTIINQ